TNDYPTISRGRMQLLIAIVLALALSVPVGAALLTLGALILEFGLGLLVEAGEKIEADPRQKKIAVTVLVVVLGGILLAICVLCVVVTLWIAAR
ncbi:MAG: hypothetical protein JXR84_02105, partial [Anaerolineae bacterium]|nr:hypothetical protein [Anaerolineae bacterium]